MAHVCAIESMDYVLNPSGITERAQWVGGSKSEYGTPPAHIRARCRFRHRGEAFLHPSNPIGGCLQDRRKTNGMQPHEDPRKRPLLTPEQLRIIRRSSERATKGTPREEFEKLFGKSNTESLTS